MNEIVIIGAGNLAWHLCTVLKMAGHQVFLVSRDLADTRGWPVPVVSYKWLSNRQPSMVFLAVPDDAIGDVSARLQGFLLSGVPVIHTSGATSIRKINSYFQHRGALWPIRSLRKGEAVNSWRDLPLVYFADTQQLTKTLYKLSNALSDTIYFLDDAQRAQLHLAAVFSNNFVTWLYQIGHELCEEKGIPFDVLLPIIKNTALKQDGSEPSLRQTGAAARGDRATMEKHLALLEGHPEYSRLYRQISQLIQIGKSR